MWKYVLLLLWNNGNIYIYISSMMCWTHEECQMATKMNDSNAWSFEIDDTERYTLFTDLSSWTDTGLTTYTNDGSALLRAGARVVEKTSNDRSTTGVLAHGRSRSIFMAMALSVAHIKRLCLWGSVLCENGILGPMTCHQVWVWNLSLMTSLVGMST